MIRRTMDWQDQDGHTRSLTYLVVMCPAHLDGVEIGTDDTHLWRIMSDAAQLDLQTAIDAPPTTATNTTPD